MEDRKFHGKLIFFYYTWSFSLAMLNYQRVLCQIPNALPVPCQVPESESDGRTDHNGHRTRPWDCDRFPKTLPGWFLSWKKPKKKWISLHDGEVPPWLFGKPSRWWFLRKGGHSRFNLLMKHGTKCWLRPVTRSQLQPHAMVTFWSCFYCFFAMVTKVAAAQHLNFDAFVRWIFMPDMSSFAICGHPQPVGREFPQHVTKSWSSRPARHLGKFHHSPEPWNHWFWKGESSP